MHDPALTDNPPVADPGKRTRPFDFQHHLYNQSHADIPAFIERIRALLDEYDGRFALAEVGGEQAPQEMKLYTQGNARLHSAYGFDYLYAEALTPDVVRRAIGNWPGAADEGWPSWAFSNHDAPRFASRWSDEAGRPAFVRVALMLLVALRGNVILYQGEELGLPQAHVPFEALHDPEALANWPQTLGRDGARTPLPWTGDPDGGFGSATPWLPIDPRHLTDNVAAQLADDGSVLHWTRRMTALRRASGALRMGSIELLDHALGPGRCLCPRASWRAPGVRVQPVGSRRQLRAGRRHGRRQLRRCRPVEPLPSSRFRIYRPMLIRWLAAALLVLAAPAVAQEQYAVSSPNKVLTATLSLNGEGRVQYRVDRNGKPVIGESQLGFLFTDQPQMLRNFAVVGQRTRDHDSTWEQPWGEQRRVRDHYRELAIDFEEKSSLKRRMTLEFRMYDDGVGFRYRLPARADGAATNIAEELTQFRLAADGRAWWAPAFESNREEYLYNDTPINGIGTAQTPLTMVLADGTHVSIHEAALVDYSGMNVARVEGTLLKAVLTPSSSGAKVSRTGAFTTPWRMLTIAPDAPSLYAARNLDPQSQRTQQAGRRKLGHPAQICRHLVGHASRDAKLGIGPQAWRDHRQRAQADRLRREEQDRRDAGRRLERRLGRRLVRQRAGVQLHQALSRFRPAADRRLREEEGRRADRPPRNLGQHRALRSADGGRVRLLRQAWHRRGQDRLRVRRGRACRR